MVKKNATLIKRKSIHHIWIGRGKILLNDLILAMCLYVLSHQWQRMHLLSQFFIFIRVYFVRVKSILV